MKAFAALAMMTALVMMLPAGSAAWASGDEARLPSGRSETSVAYLDGYVYVFGGRTASGETADILRIDAQSGAVRLMNARLPTARGQTAAVTADGSIYIFGGYDATQYISGILRYDPQEDRIEAMDASIGKPRTGSSAVWDGEDTIYVFGGRVGGVEGLTDDIVAYNVARDSARTLTVALPRAVAETSAVWDDHGRAFLFGGYAGGGFLDEIVAFDPERGMTEVLDARLPVQATWTAAAWTGETALVFGGGSGTQAYSLVTSFDPLLETATATDPMKGGSRERMGAAWTGEQVLLVGGKTMPDGKSSLIEAYSAPTSSAPAAPGIVLVLVALVAASIRRTW